jgi:hypothetical protein
VNERESRRRYCSNGQGIRSLRKRGALRQGEGKPNRKRCVKKSS